MYRTKEFVGSNILNRGFSSDYTMQNGDGQPLFSESHPTTYGTFSNKLAVDQDLSEAALEQAAIDIRNFVDFRGQKIQILPKLLIVPPELMFEAERLLKNENRPETANRDINALYMMGTFPEGFTVNNYLTDPKAWFIKTDGMMD